MCRPSAVPRHPGGVYSPAIDDGYYGEVNALGAGNHVIHAHADWQFGTVDVTYHITAVPTANQLSPTGFVR